MEFIKYSKDKKNMAQLLNNETYHSMDENAVNVIEHCTHLKLKQHIKNEKEEINMSWAIDELMEDKEIKGRTEGEIKKATEIAKNMLKAGKLANEDIAEYSGLPLDTVLTLAQELHSA